MRNVPPGIGIMPARERISAHGLCRRGDTSTYRSATISSFNRCAAAPTHQAIVYGTAKLRAMLINDSRSSRSPPEPPALHGCSLANSAGPCNLIARIPMLARVYTVRALGSLACHGRMSVRLLFDLHAAQFLLGDAASGAPAPQPDPCGHQAANPSGWMFDIVRYLWLPTIIRSVKWYRP